MIISLAIASMLTGVINALTKNQIGGIPSLLIFLAIAWGVEKLFSLTDKREKVTNNNDYAESGRSSQKTGQIEEKAPEDLEASSTVPFKSSKKEEISLQSPIYVQENQPSAVISKGENRGPLIGFAVIVLLATLILLPGLGTSSSDYPAFPIPNGIPVEGVYIDEESALSVITIKFDKFTQTQYDNLDLAGIASEQIDFLCNSSDSRKYWEKNDKIQVRFENRTGKTLFSYKVDRSCRR